MNAIIADKHIYDVNAQWGARPETAQALATRWVALIQRLQTVDLALAKWTHWEKGNGFLPFDARLETQIARIYANTQRKGDGTLVPSAGTRISNTTYPCLRSRYFMVEMSAGRADTSNQVMVGTDYITIPDPDVVTYRVLRGILLAEAETFEATQVRAYTADMRRFWDDPRGIGEELDLAWISYVAPRFAHLVTPPRSVVVERRPDGGLLMAATEEPFSIDNPGHLAAAHAIKTSLTAYNAVPWTTETGK